MCGVVHLRPLDPSKIVVCIILRQWCFTTAIRLHITELVYDASRCLRTIATDRSAYAHICERSPSRKFLRKGVEERIETFNQLSHRIFPKKDGSNGCDCHDTTEVLAVYSGYIEYSKRWLDQESSIDKHLHFATLKNILTRPPKLRYITFKETPVARIRGFSIGGHSYKNFDTNTDVRVFDRRYIHLPDEPTALSPYEDKVEKEVAILKRARHPNIVALLEVIDDSSRKNVYIVLEWMQRGEIQWRVKASKEIALVEARRYEREKRDKYASQTDAEEEALLAEAQKGLPLQSQRLRSFPRERSEASNSPEAWNTKPVADDRESDYSEDNKPSHMSTTSAKRHSSKIRFDGNSGASRLTSLLSSAKLTISTQRIRRCICHQPRSCALFPGQCRKQRTTTIPTQTWKTQYMVLMSRVMANCQRQVTKAVWRGLTFLLKVSGNSISGFCFAISGGDGSPAAKVAPSATEALPLNLLCEVVLESNPMLPS